MKRLLAIASIWILISIIGMIVGCNGSSVSGPSEYVEISPDDTVSTPDYWGNESCGSVSSVSVGRIRGRSAEPGVIWLALEHNGEQIAYSEGKSVETGIFDVGGFSIQLSSENLPSDNLEIVAFLSDSLSQVGISSLRRTQSAVTFLRLSPSTSIEMDCMETLLGDTVYLDLAYIGDGAYWIHPIAYMPSSYWDWTVRYIKDSTVDTKDFKILDPAGAFFPLKASSSKDTLGWFLQARRNGLLYAEILVSVVAPSTLGSTYNRFDNKIAYWASRHGVPVSILKALVDKESRKTTYDGVEEFDTTSYRYEPCFDKHSITGSSLISQYPYNRFNLEIPDQAENGPLARGGRLEDADTIPATNLYGGVSQNDNSPQDGFITAKEYKSNHPEQNWNGQDCGVSTLDFVAQTTVSSSWGMTQVMWSTALLAPWNGGAGGNPHLLFESDIILNLGARYLRKLFDANKEGATDWSVRWRNAIDHYNRGPNSDDLTYVYADAVLARVNNFQPNW